MFDGEKGNYYHSKSEFWSRHIENQNNSDHTQLSMLVQYIGQSVDAKISHLFITKEYRMLDRYLIDEPVPSMFSLN